MDACVAAPRETADLDGSKAPATLAKPSFGRRCGTVGGLSLLLALLQPPVAAHAADIAYYKGFTSTTVSYQAYPNSPSYVSAYLNIDYTNRVTRGYSWLDLAGASGFSGNVYTYYEKQSGSGTTGYYGNSADGVPGGRSVSATEVVLCGGGALFTSYGQFFLRSPSGTIARGTQPSSGQQTTCVR